MTCSNYAGILATARAVDFYQGLRADVEIDRAWSEILDVLLRVARTMRAAEAHSVTAAAIEVWLSGPRPDPAQTMADRDDQVYAVLAAAVGAGLIPPLTDQDDPVAALGRVEAALRGVDTTGWPEPVRQELAATLDPEEYRLVYPPVNWELLHAAITAEIGRAAGVERVRQERRALSCRTYLPRRHLH